MYIYPFAAGDVGHRQLGSAGTAGFGSGVGTRIGGGEEDRMMTSAGMNIFDELASIWR